MKKLANTLKSLALTLSLGALVLLSVYNPLHPARVAVRTARWIADKITEPATKPPIASKAIRRSDSTEQKPTISGGSAWISQGTGAAPRHGDSFCYVAAEAGGSWAPCSSTGLTAYASSLPPRSAPRTVRVDQGGVGTVSSGSNSALTITRSITSGSVRQQARTQR